MEALKLSSQLTLLTFISLIFFAQISPSSASPTDVVSGDHDAAARYYKNLINDAKIRLQENRAILEEYGAHPYYYGRHGQDLRSHTLLAFISLVFFAQISPSSASPTDAVSGDHDAAARYYENLVNDAKIRLQENRAILEEYEAHPYYYGRQGQDLRSHAAANIREYEKALQENLSNASFHKRMAAESNHRVNKASINLNHNERSLQDSTNYQIRYNF